jgi:hypothetical protein
MSTAIASARYVEPWLRGSNAEVPAAGRAVLHALDHGNLIRIVGNYKRWQGFLTCVQIARDGS